MIVVAIERTIVSQFLDRKGRLLDNPNGSNLLYVLVTQLWNIREWRLRGACRRVGLLIGGIRGTWRYFLWPRSTGVTEFRATQRPDVGWVAILFV